MNVDYSLSLSDLLLIKEFQEAYGKQDKNLIEAILFNNGLNSNEPYDEVMCEHRNLRGQAVTCIRYEGEERLDKEWIKSGAASLDALIASEKDPHMRVTLRTMSKQSQTDKQWELLEN